MQHSIYTWQHCTLHQGTEVKVLSHPPFSFSPVHTYSLDHSSHSRLGDKVISKLLKSSLWEENSLKRRIKNSELFSTAKGPSALVLFPLKPGMLMLVSLGGEYETFFSKQLQISLNWKHILVLENNSLAIAFTRKPCCKHSSRLCCKDLSGWIVLSNAGPVSIFGHARPGFDVVYMEMWWLVHTPRKSVNKSSGGLYFQRVQDKWFFSDTAPSL